MCKILVLVEITSINAGRYEKKEERIKEELKKIPGVRDVYYGTPLEKNGTNMRLIADVSEDSRDIESTRREIIEMCEKTEDDSQDLSVNITEIIDPKKFNIKEWVTTEIKKKVESENAILIDDPKIFEKIQDGIEY